MRTLAPIEYRCYLLDLYGQIVWRHKFTVSDDGEAIAAARTLFRQRRTSVCGFELWQDERYLHCENDPVVLDFWTPGGTQRAPRRLFGWPHRSLARRHHYV